jgi:hypothetical protein
VSRIARWTRGAALLLLDHAARVAPVERKDWSAAMRNELDHIADTAVLRWAAGCTWVSYQERMGAMTRSLTTVAPWLLCLEALLCFVSLTWLFVAVLIMAARGAMPPELAILYGTGCVLGPIGLGVTVRTVFISAGAMGRIASTVLVVLAVWTAIAYTAQVAHNALPLAGWWREYVLIVILPCWAVFHLLRINSERRTAVAVA